MQAIDAAAMFGAESSGSCCSSHQLTAVIMHNKRHSTAAEHYVVARLIAPECWVLVDDATVMPLKSLSCMAALATSHAKFGGVLQPAVLVYSAHR